MVNKAIYTPDKGYRDEQNFGSQICLQEISPACTHLAVYNIGNS